MTRPLSWIGMLYARRPELVILLLALGFVVGFGVLGPALFG